MNTAKTNIEGALKSGAHEIVTGFELASKSNILLIRVDIIETFEKLI